MRLRIRKLFSTFKHNFHSCISWGNTKKHIQLPAISRQCYHIDITLTKCLVSPKMFLYKWYYVFGDLPRYFWCLMQICVNLKCSFVYSTARISPYFFGQWFWFVLPVLVSKFSIAFRPWSSIFFFFWWCFGAPVWSF